MSLLMLIRILIKKFTLPIQVIREKYQNKNYLNQTLNLHGSKWMCFSPLYRLTLLAFVNLTSYVVTYTYEGEKKFVMIRNCYNLKEIFKQNECR